MDIRNDQELIKELSLVMSSVIEDISKEIREKLQNRIMKDVYLFAYFPNYKYEGGTGEPSWEFLEAYRWKQTKIVAGSISKELYYAHENMTIDKTTGRHYEGGMDMRKRLNDLLNTNNVFGRKTRRTYWDNFLEEIEDEIDSMYKDAMRKHGLNII